jgi:hypothetical protein
LYFQIFPKLQLILIKLESPVADYTHSQQKQSMPPSLYLNIPVLPIPVSDRHINNFPIQTGRAEQQVKIAERVEIAEIRAIGHDAGIILLPEHFRSAKSVFNGLAEEPTEEFSKNMICNHVQKSHGFIVHWIHHSAPINELTMT